MAEKEFRAEESVDVRKVPKRIAFIKNRTSAKVTKDEEEMEMTVPHLLIREIIAFEIMVIVLALTSLFFDAPLEWIANPDNTPNPAKAPWYFLGLQELLHYFPPIVGGVILPLLVVIALVVIPYFNINLKSGGMWKDNRRRTLAVVLASVALFVIVLSVFGVWAMVVPTLVLTGAMLVPYFSKKKTAMVLFISERPLSWWIMTWFVVIVVVLTVIGTLFRGPGWSWTWPWVRIY